MEPVSPLVERYLPDDDYDAVGCMLPAQEELYTDTDNRFVGFVAGLGAGKTRAAVYKTYQLGEANPGLPGIFCEPTYAMIEYVAIPMFLEVLDEWGFKEGEDFTYTRRPPQRMEIFTEAGPFQIWFRSSDNPRSLVGPNVAWVIVDEADDHPEEAAKTLSGRFRHPRAKQRQMICVGTPENMGGWFQEWFETPTPAMESSTSLIRARTTDNYFLPDDYVELNLGHLDEDERRRYVDGEFVVKGGRVYTNFVPRRHEVVCPDPARGQQVMACDFGTGCMAWGMGRILDGTHKDIWERIQRAPSAAKAFEWADAEVHFHGEQVLESYDTHDATKAAAAWWQSFFLRHNGERLSSREAASRVNVYCDPAGAKSSASDIRILKEAGFRVFHRRRHPPVEDRVNAVQMKFYYQQLLIDPESCPYLAKCFKRQARDERTGEPQKAKPREGKKGMDHGPDAVGYLIEFEFQAAAVKGRSYHYS